MSTRIASNVRSAGSVRRLAGLAVSLGVLAAVTTSGVGAIANGQPDATGHPYTGVLVADYAVPGYLQRYCSGTLAAPRIVITAAHCLEADIDAQNIWVSFDPVYRPGTSTIYHGHMVTAVDPTKFVGSAGYAGQYGNSNGADDIAVVHLDAAPGITPAKLPTAGLLSTMDLRGQAFTAVGYGRTRVNKTKGPNNIEPNFDPDVRSVANQSFRSLQDYLLTLSQNPATGDGGWCFGDSGSANLVGDSDIMASLTTLTDSACRATGRGFRLDTQLARQFLASQGVSLP